MIKDIDQISSGRHDENIENDKIVSLVKTEKRTKENPDLFKRNSFQLLTHEWSLAFVIIDNECT